MTPKLQASGEVLVVYPHDTAVLEGSEEYAESMDLEDLKLSGDPTYFVIRPLSSYEWEEMQAAMMARAGRLAAKGDEDAFATSAIRLLYDAFERACVRIIRPDGEHLDRDQWRRLPFDVRMFVGRCIKRISVGDGDDILKL